MADGQGQGQPGQFQMPHDPAVQLMVKCKN